MRDRKQLMNMGTKKQYFIPEIEVMLMNTAYVMKTSEDSDDPTPPGAPERREPAF